MARAGRWPGPDRWPARAQGTQPAGHAGQWTALALAALAAPVGAALVPEWALPLRTAGGDVVDAGGRPVRLECVNWYGAQQGQMVANGLNKRALGDMARVTVEMGFNCVRLPYSLDLVEHGSQGLVPNASIALAANPELQRKSPLAVFDKTVAALTDAGLMVILNNHVSSASWCCSFMDDEGLWYTQKYPYAAWLNHLTRVARRYRGNPLVVGIDLRNEVRPSPQGWPAWGKGPPELDWAIASAEGGKRVVAEAPGMLVIVSGLMFGMFLCDVEHKPIHAPGSELAGRVLYTVHSYPWFSIPIIANQAITILGAALALGVALYWAKLPLQTCLASRLAGRVCCGCPQWHCPKGARRLGATAQGRCCTRLPVWRCGRVAACCTCSVRVRLAAAALVGAAAAAALPAAMALEKRCDRHMVWLFLVSFVCGVLCFVLVARELLHQATTAGEDEGARSLGRQPRAALPGPWAEAPSVAGSAPTAAAPRALRILATQLSAVCSLVALAAVFGRYDMYRENLDAQWGYLTKASSAHPAPVWLSEFGAQSTSLWWDHTMRYMRETGIGWAYWSLNGEQRPGDPEPYGLLDVEERMPGRDSSVLAGLRALMTAGNHRAALGG